MPDLGKAYVQIVPSAQGIGKNISSAIAPGASEAGTAAGKNIAANIGGTLQKVGGGMMKAGAIATAVSVPIIAGIHKAMSAYEVQSAAETKLTEIYKTRMGATKQAAQATMDLASALQKEGIIGDEVQLSGAQQLATFAKMPDTVNTLLPAMNNLLAQQKGYNATAEDATGIANLMGKVMNGQVGALKRVGISFDENQEKMLKAGTEEEKAAVLAQVITDNVGNMNKTMAETDLGKIQQMKNSMGDLVEEIGGALAPALSQVADFISTNIVPVIQQVVGFLQANPIIGNIVLAITGLLAVGGPLLIILGSIVSAVGALIPVVTAITAPMIGIAAGIGLLVAALITAWTQSEAFRNAIMNLVSQLGPVLMPVVDSVISVFKILFNEFVACATAIGNDLAPVITALTPILVKVATVVGGVLKKGFSVLGSVIKVLGAVIRALSTIFSGTFLAVIKIVTGAYNKIKGFITKLISSFSFSGLASKVSGVFNKVKEVITKPIGAAKDFIKGAIDKIKGFFPLSIGKIFSGMKLPHFNISGGKPPFGIGGLGTKPKIDVSWYAKGGIVDGATLIGAGEKGAEAIVPLDPFWKKLDKVQGGNTFNITMNVDGAKNPKAWAKEFSRSLELEMRTI